MTTPVTNAAMQDSSKSSLMTLPIISPLCVPSPLLLAPRSPLTWSGASQSKLPSAASASRATRDVAAHVRGVVAIDRALGQAAESSVPVAYLPAAQIDDHSHPRLRCHAIRILRLRRYLGRCVAVGLHFARKRRVILLSGGMVLGCAIQTRTLLRGTGLLTTRNISGGAAAQGPSRRRGQNNSAMRRLRVPKQSERAPNRGHKENWLHIVSDWEQCRVVAFVTKTRSSRS
jgi:hypothetical protein